MARQAQEGDDAVDQITRDDGSTAPNSDTPRTGPLTAEELRQHAAANRSPAGVPAAVDVNPHRQVIPAGSPFATGIQLTEKELPFRVSPSLDERLIDGIEDAEEFAGHLQVAKHALSHASNALNLLDEAYRAMSKDTSLTDTGKVLRLEPGASKALDSICKTFDKAMLNLNTAIKQIDQQLNAPVVSASQTAASAELRTVLRGMSDTERNKVVERAFADNDEAILAASLGAHPLASGLNPMFHAIMHRRIREKRNPELMRRRAATEKAIAVLERAAPTIFRQIEAAARFKYANLKGLKEKADASAAALAKLGNFPVHHD